MDTAVASPLPPAPAAPAKKERLESIDVLRGLVMAVMALDHVRDFFTDVKFNSMDPAVTTVPLFLTRFATHYCAPAFFFLAGLGACLSGTRGKAKGELARFLFTRGAFLVAVDLTLVRVGWDFNFAYHGGPWLIVLTALGLSMMILAGLVFLPVPAVGALGVVVIAGHNLFDHVSPESLGALEPLWVFLHVRAGSEVAGIPFYVSYPLIPWVGVMLVGYAFGPVMLLERPRRVRVLLATGAALVALFVVLRGLRLYGDPRPWAQHFEGVANVMAFLRTKKYPASMQYLLMTLGPTLIALGLLDGVKGPVARVFLTLGRVPLFFYVAHLYLIHALALAGGALQGYPVRDFCVLYSQLPSDYGYSLPVVYLVWLLVLVGLYPVCAWFSDLKRRSKAAWLSYL